MANTRRHGTRARVTKPDKLRLYGRQESAELTAWLHYLDMVREGFEYFLPHEHSIAIECLLELAAHEGQRGPRPS